MRTIRNSRKILILKMLFAVTFFLTLALYQFLKNRKILINFSLFFVDHPDTYTHHLVFLANLF